MSIRRIGGFLVGIGIVSLLLQLVGMQLMFFWFLDGAGPRLAIVFKAAVIVVGFLVWKYAED